MKKLYAFGMAIALMAPAVAFAAPAGAAAIVTCTKPSGSVVFTPGLSSTPHKQTTTFTLPVKGCKGTGGVTSGSSKGKSVGKTAQTCATFATASNTTTTVTITWNNKKTSTAALATKVSASGSSLIATVKGKITAGLFKGKTAATQVKLTLKGKCTPAAPLKSATLTGLKPFTIS